MLYYTNWVCLGNATLELKGFNRLMVPNITPFADLLLSSPFQMEFCRMVQHAKKASNNSDVNDFSYIDTAVANFLATKKFQILDCCLCEARFPMFFRKNPDLQIFWGIFRFLPSIYERTPSDGDAAPEPDKPATVA